MDTFEAIHLRQSVRSYTEKQITKGELENLLRAANAAPVAMARFADMHLTVIQNREILKKITVQAQKVSGKPDLTPFYGAPCVILVSCTPRNNTIYANAACMVENMALAATAMGLGSVYLWGFIDSLSQNADLVKELEVPEGFVPVSAIAVGYAVEPLQAREASMNKIRTNFVF